MARRKSQILTEVESQLMSILWDKGQGTVHEVWEAMNGHMAYTTVATMLNILEKKGYLTHDVNGRTYVYKPVQKRHEVEHSILQYLIDRFYKGSSMGLVSHLVRSGELSQTHLAELKQMIEDAEQQEEEKGKRP